MSLLWSERSSIRKHVLGQHMKCILLALCFISQGCYIARWASPIFRPQLHVNILDLFTYYYFKFLGHACLNVIVRMLPF